MTDRPVCVTGVTGYIASFIVKDLLEHGYTVHGTHRKNANTSSLRALPHASTNLRLFEADLLDPSTMPAALHNCHTLIHTATPVLIPADGSIPFMDMQEAEEKQLRPAVEGTRAILQAAVDAGIKNVVLTSSIAAVSRTSPPPEVLDESCWSDVEFARSQMKTKGAGVYALSKTLQERLAWSFAKEKEIRLVCINPAVVIGPTITGRLNASMEFLLKMASGEGWAFAKECRKGMLPDDWVRLVDVRDVARAHVLGMEKGEGRYLLLTHLVHCRDVVEAMREAEDKFKDFPVLEVDTGSEGDMSWVKFDNSKMIALGVKGIAWQDSVGEAAKALAVHLK